MDPESTPFAQFTKNPLRPAPILADGWLVATMGDRIITHLYTSIPSLPQGTRYVAGSDMASLSEEVVPTDGPPVTHEINATFMLPASHARRLGKQLVEAADLLETAQEPTEATE
ncbi:MAG: hypothetical protein F4Z31_02735 [Gemmatimonadetes bacterium]|nr:hypothetical protein [Gemmatimonadota bacterium]MYE92484.1 hypothetical protein [Gemmatimonadota bacterium]MYJ10914.1 hypothetical protein [Gemmatimonadota bacterium]